MNNAIAIIISLSIIIFSSPLISKMLKIPTITMEMEAQEKKRIQSLS